MYKSLYGLPDPVFPRNVDLAAEARKARHRLYPVSVAYSAYAWVVLGLALSQARRPALAVLFFLAGAAAWTYVEYLAHRYVLHGRFPDGAGSIRHATHRLFDHLHYEHHRRPWDGNHINGTLKDTLPFVALFALVASVAPIETAPAFVAGLIQSYIVEEWVHHSVHFYRFRNPYFRYIRKHHLYHHSPRGAEVGFGLTNGFWDIVCRTRIPLEARRLLYAGGRRVTPAA